MYLCVSVWCVCFFCLCFHVFAVQVCVLREDFRVVCG